MTVFPPPPPSPDKAASSPVLSWRRGQRRSGRHLCCSVSHLIHLSNKLSASELCNSAVFCSWLVLPKVMVWHNLMNKCRWLKHLSGWPLFISVASLRLLLSSCLHRCLFMQIWGQWLSFLKLWCCPKRSLKSPTFVSRGLQRSVERGTEEERKLHRYVWL